MPNQTMKTGSNARCGTIRRACSGGSMTFSATFTSPANRPSNTPAVKTDGEALRDPFHRRRKVDLELTAHDELDRGVRDLAWRRHQHPEPVG
jgi:hypothetical protein